jgi:RluA family pseudouridine synthase
MSRDSIDLNPGLTKAYRNALVHFDGSFHQELPEEFPRTRLDVYLSSLSSVVSRNFWHKALDGDWIRVNSQIVKKSQLVKAGDLIEFDYYSVYRALQKEELRISIPYQILQRNENYVVIEKPEGYLTHRIGFIDHSVMSQVAQDVGTTLYTVHRLDKFTSGVCVFATSSHSADRLQALLRSGGFFKYYLVATHKKLRSHSGVMTEPIGKDDPRIHKKKQKVDFESGLGAKTRFRYLCSRNGMNYYVVRIFTGRQHQIRVHFQYAGAPVTNDELYSYEDYSMFPPMHKYSEKDLGLHSLRLRFTCPFEHRWVSFTSFPKRPPF